MSFFSDLFNNNRSAPSAVNPNSTLGNYFQGSTRTLPNGGGQYVTPTSTTPQQRSTLSAPTGTPNWGSPRIGAQPPAPYAPTRQPASSPAVSRSPQPQSSPMQAGGAGTSPQDMALIANSIRAEQQRETGDIGSYAEGAYADMNRLKNVRDDIATGVNDPYEWAGGSGIPYSPQELSAIESAMAGIYDPAIESAKAKYERAARMDEMKYESQLRREEMKDEYGYKSSIENSKNTGNKTSTEMASLIDSQLAQSGIVMTNLDKAINLVTNSPGSTTGLVGQVGSIIGGTKAHNLSNLIDPIVASIGFDRLQRMRDESKTGGALGQVAVRELDMLQATMGSLKQSQDDKQLLENLAIVKQQYAKTIQALEAARIEAMGGSSGQGQDSYGMPTYPGYQYDPNTGKYYESSFKSAGSGASNAQSIASAIKQVESSGNYNARGGSGEYGAYQFMPNTWKDWAGKYLGNPNASMTQQNQDTVALAKINELINQGYNPQQIALIWNGGSPTVKKGVNKYGVAYDSGAYANKILKTLNQLA